VELLEQDQAQKLKLRYGTLGFHLCLMIRMGELEPWVDEGYVRNIWYSMGEQVNVKMIRDKFTGYQGLRFKTKLLEITLDIVLSTSCLPKLPPKR
jgi:hypothetical protein